MKIQIKYMLENLNKSYTLNEKRMNKLNRFAAILLIMLASANYAIGQSVALDVPYVPTKEVVVEEMLKMANVSGNDVLYDLGSGDGRIPITAAKKFGTRGVGVDINPLRIEEANANAKNANVTDKVKFIEGNLFDMDFSEATVLTLYLLPQVNMKLRPKILNLKPGTRVVSHNYDMGDWEPEQVKKIETDNGYVHTIYYWVVPEKTSNN